MLVSMALVSMLVPVVLVSVALVSEEEVGISIDGSVLVVLDDVGSVVVDTIMLDSKPDADNVYELLQEDVVSNVVAAS